MKKLIPVISLSVLLMTACGGKSKNDKNFPEDFDKLSDRQKVAYLMQHASADSVARFIIYASLGDIAGVHIDTLSNATLKAYETYTDTALQSFSWEFDRLAEELPLHKKMKLRALVGAEDPQGLGLTVGLEYLNQIRVKGMSADQVLEELNALKKASKEDPDLYARFLIGFRTVLRYDRNADMPKDIYTKFLNYDEEAVQEYYKRNKAVKVAPVDISDSLTSATEESPEYLSADSIPSDY